MPIFSLDTHARTNSIDVLSQVWQVAGVRMCVGCVGGVARCLNTEPRKVLVCKGRQACVVVVAPVARKPGACSVCRWQVVYACKVCMAGVCSQSVACKAKCR